MVDKCIRNLPLSFSEPTVLVVEDKLDHQREIVKVVSRHVPPNNIVCAEDPTNAERVFFERSPRITFMDIDLGGSTQTGTDLIYRFKVPTPDVIPCAIYVVSAHIDAMRRSSKLDDLERLRFISGNVAKTRTTHDWISKVEGEMKKGLDLCRTIQIIQRGSSTIPPQFGVLVDVLAYCDTYVAIRYSDYEPRKVLFAIKQAVDNYRKKNPCSGIKVFKATNVRSEKADIYLPFGAVGGKAPEFGAPLTHMRNAFKALSIGDMIPIKSRWVQKKNFLSVGRTEIKIDLDLLDMIEFL